MDAKILQPKQSAYRTEGFLSYGENVRGWNVIRLKKEFINEFSDLKEKTAKFMYNLIFYRTYEELEAAIKKMKSDEKPLPLILFLSKINP